MVLLLLGVVARTRAHPQQREALNIAMWLQGEQDQKHSQRESECAVPRQRYVSRQRNLSRQRNVSREKGKSLARIVDGIKEEKIWRDRKMKEALKEKKDKIYKLHAGSLMNSRILKNMNMKRPFKSFSVSDQKIDSADLYFNKRISAKLLRERSLDKKKSNCFESVKKDVLFSKYLDATNNTKFSKRVLTLRRSEKIPIIKEESIYSTTNTNYLESHRKLALFSRCSPPRVRFRRASSSPESSLCAVPVSEGALSCSAASRLSSLRMLSSYLSPLLCAAPSFSLKSYSSWRRRGLRGVTTTEEVAEAIRRSTLEQHKQKVATETIQNALERVALEINQNHYIR